MNLKTQFLIHYSGDQFRSHPIPVFHRLPPRLLVPAFALLLGLSGCRDARPPATQLDIEISHVAGDAPLALGSTVTTAAGEALTVSKLNYYLSNLRLLRADGSAWTVANDAKTADGYWLIDLAKPETLKFALNSAPAGEYSGMELLIGVDSARNAAGAQTGTLDITRWLRFATSCVAQAYLDAATCVDRVMQIAWFWVRHRGVALNERQRKALERALSSDELDDGWLTNRRYLS